MQGEIFKRLGWILYCTRSGPHAMDALEEFMQVFIDQYAFMDYFKRRWLPNIGISYRCLSFDLVNDILLRLEDLFAVLGQISFSFFLFFLVRLAFIELSERRVVVGIIT